MIKTDLENLLLTGILDINQDIADSIRTHMKNYDKYVATDEPLLAAVEQARYQVLGRVLEQGNNLVSEVLRISDDRDTEVGPIPLSDIQTVLKKLN